MEDISIRKLLETTWRKKEIIIGIMIIIVLLGILYTFMIKKPLYISTAKILIERNETVVNELVKSDEVLNQVKDKLQITTSLEELRKQIQSKYNKDTKMIQISCTSLSSSYSNKIVQEITEVYVKTLDETLGLKNTNVIQQSIQAEVPYNINHYKDIAIALIIGIVLIGIYLLIITLMDTTVKEKEVIESSLKMKVLGILPQTEKEGK